MDAYVGEAFIAAQRRRRGMDRAPSTRGRNTEKLFNEFISRLLLRFSQFPLNVGLWLLCVNPKVTTDKCWQTCTQVDEEEKEDVGAAITQQICLHHISSLLWRKNTTIDPPHCFLPPPPGSDSVSHSSFSLFTSLHFLKFANIRLSRSRFQSQTDHNQADKQQSFLL